MAELINDGTILPISYDLCIKVTFEEPWIFDGLVKISLKSSEETKTFSLHCEDLEIIETVPKSSLSKKAKLLHLILKNLLRH